MTQILVLPMKSAVDEYGAVCAEISKLKAVKEKLRQKLIGLDREVLVGHSYTVNVSESSRTNLDTDKIRAEMTLAWIRKYSVENSVVTVSVKKNKPVKIAQAAKKTKA